VSPCSAQREEDKDYAVVFAVPANAEGITQIVSPPGTDEVGDEAAWDWPISGRRGGATESLIIFDDVFIPWDRVFMCGEWQFSRDIAWAFGTFHRIYGTAHTVANLEVKAGAAALMAEYNGLLKYPHIREKLAWLAMHSETCDAMTKAACEHPDIDRDSGYAVPNLVFSNIAKFKFANDAAESSKILGDICGGLVYDVFSYKDWNNLEVRPFLEKYMAGKEGIPSEHRLRALRLAKDLTGLNHDQKDIHAEGSLAAQIMAIYAGADWQRYTAAAKRIAGIPGWEDHPVFSKLPEYPPKGLVE
jgi:4-hydroxybutyryl-CoA dehydratase/vinylacetyl-CoA-Delta-isomerase